MKAGQEMIARWRGDAAMRWPVLALVATAALISVVMAVLWYPPPALPLLQRLLAALLLASALLAGGLRLARWLRSNPARPIDKANLIALSALAGGCVVVMIVGGPLLAALQRSISSLILLLGLIAGGVAAVGLLGLATRDLAQLVAREEDTAEAASAVAADLTSEAAAMPTGDDAPIAAADGAAVAAMAETVPAAPVAAPIPAPIPVPARGMWAWLDSKWTLAVLVVLLLVAGGNYLARQGYLSGLMAFMPADGPTEPSEPAAQEAPAAAVPGAPMPVTEVTAREVTPLRGATVAGTQPLDDARGLVVAPDGRIYVVETGAKQVVEFDAQGKEVRRLGGPGQGDGQFEEPVAVAVDSTGKVHVLDAQRNGVQVFSKDGRYLSAYGGAQTSYRPRGLALGDDGNLYMADTGRSRVLRLTETGEQEDVLPPNWEARPAPIDQPTASVSGAGTVYIAEPTRARLHRLTSDGTPTGPAWTIAGSDTLRSARLTLGPRTEVVLAEVGAGRVVLICPGGATPLAWKLDSGQPRGAALAPDGALYVVDNEGTLLRARLAQGC